MRGWIVAAGFVAAASTAQAEPFSWRCVAQDMRVCGPSGKCTKAETRQLFQISGDGAAGSVQFCPPKKECRTFGEISIEARGSDSLLKGTDAGFTGFVSAKMGFQAAGRFQSGGSGYTYAAAGTCSAADASAAGNVSPGDISAKTDQIMRDGRAGQFRRRYLAEFPGTKVFCGDENADACRRFTVYPGSGGADVEFGGGHTIIRVRTGYVTTYRDSDWGVLRSLLERLPKVIDDRFSLPTLYLPSCDVTKTTTLDRSTIVEEPTSDGRCVVTVRIE